MADLSILYESQRGSTDLVDLCYEAHRVERDYLGLSACGAECKRHLWYVYQGRPQKPIEGRVLRLFQLGNIIEDQVVEDLTAAGFPVKDSQREVVFTQEEYILKGHIDGIVTGLIEAPKTEHLFECKSCSLKKFKELQKAIAEHGKTGPAYRQWNEVYYWQVQFYMLGLKLKRAAAFIYCKDNSELVLLRIKLDRQGTIDKLQSVFETIRSPIAPDRTCPRADFFKAKWCPHYHTCFGIPFPEVEPAAVEPDAYKAFLDWIRQ